MPSLSDVITRTKREIGLPSGVKIAVTKDGGEAVHGRTKIVTAGLDRLLNEANLLDMRVGAFCERFGRCIGAQIGARVTLEFAGQVVDGRRALKTLT
jgi:hypothetical protein